MSDSIYTASASGDSWVLAGKILIVVGVVGGLATALAFLILYIIEALKATSSSSSSSSSRSTASIADVKVDIGHEAPRRRQAPANKPVEFETIRQNIPEPEIEAFQTFLPLGDDDDMATF